MGNLPSHHSQAPYPAQKHLPLLAAAAALQGPVQSHTEHMTRQQMLSHSLQHSHDLRQEIFHSINYTQIIQL